MLRQCIKSLDHSRSHSFQGFAFCTQAPTASIYTCTKNLSEEYSPRPRIHQLFSPLLSCPALGLQSADATVSALPALLFTLGPRAAPELVAAPLCVAQLVCTASCRGSFKHARHKPTQPKAPSSQRLSGWGALAGDEMTHLLGHCRWQQLDAVQFNSLRCSDRA
jgi:hypothetical protein